MAKCEGCPIAVGTCLGEPGSNALVCYYIMTFPSYRAEADVFAAYSSTRRGIEAAGDPPAVITADDLIVLVEACPNRGAILPFEPGVDCDTCGDIHACALNKGRVPGRVLLTDCVRCRWEERVAGRI